MINQLIETTVHKITKFNPAANTDVRSLVSFYLSQNGFQVVDLKLLSTRELIDVAREVSGLNFSFMGEDRWGKLFDDDGELLDAGEAHSPVPLDFTKKQHYEVVTALRSEIEGKFSNVKVYSQPESILFHVNKAGLVFAWSGLKIVNNDICGTVTFPENSLFAHVGEPETDKKRYRLMRKALDVKFVSIGDYKKTSYVVDKVEDLEFILNELICLV